MSLKIGMLVLCHFFYTGEPEQGKSQDAAVESAQVEQSQKPHKLIGTVKNIHKIKEYKTESVNGKVFAFDEEKIILDVLSKKEDTRMYINANACVPVGTKAEYEAEKAAFEKKKEEIRIKNEQIKSGAKEVKESKDVTGSTQSSDAEKLLVKVLKDSLKKDEGSNIEKTEDKNKAIEPTSQSPEEKNDKNSDSEENKKEFSSQEDLKDESTQKEEPKKEPTDVPVFKQVIKDIFGK